ncbi:MAG: Gfo/Idh/MocA family oxidoreductase [Chloroflexota bacterium]
MRLAILSYSHHGRSIGRTARELGHEIVGVMDPAEGPRKQLMDDFECPGYATAGECLDACQPDAVLVAGIHVEMPSHVDACVERRIPYLLDKPFADCADRLRPVAERSEAAGVFSALTLPNRATKLVALVNEMLADGSFGEPILYSSRLNNGPPSRYDPTPSAWHNDPSLSGGGSWGVEAAHGIDTFLQFAGLQSTEDIMVVGAVMSNAMHGRIVEDTGVGMLRTSNGITGIIESGYSYPAGLRAGDHFFRFLGTKASVFERYDNDGVPIIEVHTTDGITFSEDISHGERMRNIINSALTAIEAGETSFMPNIMDAVRILEVQDAVYAQARSADITNGPNPMGI